MSHSFSRCAVWTIFSLSALWRSEVALYWVSFIWKPRVFPAAFRIGLSLFYFKPSPTFFNSEVSGSLDCAVMLRLALRSMFYAFGTLKFQKGEVITLIVFDDSFASLIRSVTVFDSTCFSLLNVWFTTNDLSKTFCGSRGGLGPSNVFMGLSARLTMSILASCCYLGI